MIIVISIEIIIKKNKETINQKYTILDFRIKLFYYESRPSHYGCEGCGFDPHKPPQTEKQTSIEVCFFVVSLFDTYK